MGEDGTKNPTNLVLFAETSRCFLMATLRNRIQHISGREQVLAPEWAVQARFPGKFPKSANASQISYRDTCERTGMEMMSVYYLKSMDIHSSMPYFPRACDLPVCYCLQVPHSKKGKFHEDVTFHAAFYIMSLPMVLSRY